MALPSGSRLSFGEASVGSGPTRSMNGADGAGCRSRLQPVQGDQRGIDGVVPGEQAAGLWAGRADLGVGIG